MTWDTLKTYLEPLSEGATWTLALFFASALLAVVVGLLVCFARMSGHAWLRASAKTYIEIVRGTPLLVQLFFIYYGLPELGVVMPQALRTIFPALGNYALVLVKDTSLVAVISVYELMRAGQMLAGATFRSLLVYSMVGAIYFLMCSVLSYVFRRIEKRLTVPGYWDGASEHNPITKI